MREPRARPRPGSRRRSPIEFRLWLGGALVGAFMLAGVLAPVLAPFDPVRQDYTHMLVPPGRHYLLGTDEFGRDLFSRLIWGGRVSLAVSFGAVLLAAGVGVPVGVAAAYYGRFLDLALMRTVDFIMVFPPILLAVGMVAFLTPSIANLMIMIGFLYFPRFARLAYSTSLQVKTSLFVEASRAAGSRDIRILGHHIVPNIGHVLIVQVPLALGFAILLESSLSFLGLGVQPPNPSWGLMVADARNVMGHSPLNLVWPALAITVIVLSLNLASDGLRGRIDPRLRRA